MGRRSRGKKRRAAAARKEYPGGWREVLTKHPLTSKGYALRTGDDAHDLQARREQKIAKAKDWFAPRGARHP